MPSAETFTIPPIRELLMRYIDRSKNTLDPFARNAKWGTHTNDENPATDATYHLDARDFLDEMIAAGTRFDCALFDPPYSNRQAKRCYQGYGRVFTQEDGQMGRMYRECKDRIDRLMKPGGIVISFGWQSSGMGRTRGYDLIEIMLVNHGGSRNDTIVTVERKRYIREYRRGKWRADIDTHSTMDESVLYDEPLCL